MSPQLLASTGCGASGSISDQTGFEDADGNLAPGSGCTDWNSFSPSWSGNTGTATLGGLSFIGLTDPTNSSTDSIYAGGVKQDTVCPAVTTGNVNDKADLGRIYVATETVGGHVYLFLAWERQIDNTIKSDVFVSFEFNQGNLACANKDGFVQRTKGDLLFDYNFQSGNSTIDANEWDGSTWQPLQAPPFEAAVNSGTVTDSIGPNGSASLTTFEFGEAGLDLSALNLAGNGGKACETFGSVLGGSRTSKSGDTAQLKDYVGPAPVDVSNCVQPTVTTTLKNAAGDVTIPNNSSVALGSSVYDTATLGNLVSGKVPTGTVTYTFFTNGTCTGTGTSAGTVTLASGSAPQSDTEGPLAAGNYSFHAQYSSGNDPNYTDSEPSACEPFKISKANSATATVVKDHSGTTVDSANPAALGSKVHDTATVTASPFTATGSVTYQLYSGLTCASGSELGSAQQVTLNAGNVPDSAETAALQAGSYSYQAVYSGDSNYNGSTGTCEPFKVSKANSATATVVKDHSGTTVDSANPAALGSKVHDTATVTASPFTATGSVTYQLYSGLTCASGSELGSAQQVTLNAGNVPDSAETAALQAGSYSYQAVYSGDSNYNGSTGTCEPFKVAQASTTTATTVFDAGTNDVWSGTESTGAKAYDTAAVTAGPFTATGTVSYTFFANGSCQGTGSDAGTVTLAAGDVPNSDTTAALQAGSYSFQATYSGDKNYTGSTGPCEPFSLGVNPTSTTTTVFDAKTNAAWTGTESTGATAYDTATVSGQQGQIVPTGTVSYQLFRGLDCKAGNEIGSADQVTMSGGNVPHSSATDPLQAGDYSYQAVYSGDSNYATSTGDCEPFSVAKGTSSITTTVFDAKTDAAWSGTESTGASAYDTSSVSPSDGFTATGTASYQLFSGLDCKAGNEIGSADQVTMSGGNVPHSSATDPLQAGDYSYQAVYSGDSNYKGSTGDCEPFSVGKATPSITTTQDPASGSVGDTYKDKATLTGSVQQDGSGSITWTLYPNNDCTGTPLGTDTVSEVDANGTFETPTGVKVNSAGTYYWVAQYSGDSNNQSATSGCADEPVVVNGAAIHIAKTADAAKVSVGSDIGFTMTVWNSGNGDAHGVTLNDKLPTNPGLAWKVAAQGAGWGGSCSINQGTLSCGPGTVPAGTTQAASTFTVHITSTTSPATSGDCPGSGTVDNTGTVTTSNDGTDQSSASTCVQALVDLSITKSGSPATQELGAGNITWTMIVTNHGPSSDSGVKVSDPMPAGNTFVSATSTQGTCTGGAILNCDIGAMDAGASVTITLITTPSATGTQTNTAVVSGDRSETDVSNNTATASVEITGAPFIPCINIKRITPGQLIVGRKTVVTIYLAGNGRQVKGTRVRIKGAGIHVTTKAANSKGVIKHTLKMKRKGVLLFTPINGPTSQTCSGKRIGVRGVFTPPVTG